MKRSTPCKLLLAAVLPILAGCANDAERTALEGTLLGTGTGALVGAGLGYAVTGNTSGALTGAAIGGAGGTLIGGAMGRHAAFDKAEYARRADYLAACASQARAVSQQMALYNQSLARHLAELDSETADALAIRQKNPSTPPPAKPVQETPPTANPTQPAPANAPGPRREIAANLRDTQDKLVRVQAEIDVQSTVLEAESAQPDPRLRPIEEEIHRLEARKAELKIMMERLQSLDNRMALGS